MRFTAILLSFVFYISFAAAWPWPANLFIRDSDGHLSRRQDSSESSSSAAPASSAASSSPSQTGSATGSGSASNPTTTSGSSDSNSNSNSTTTSSISITQAEAGGVSMISPAAASTTYYRSGEVITWAWDYTSLVVTPTAVNVLVSCSSVGATYTLTTGMTIAANATATMTWDTAKESNANPPPDTNQYTLAIYDASNPAGPTQVVSAGKLGVWDQFTFGMYVPQPYTSLQDGWQCVTCSAGVLSADRQTFGVVFTMAALTVMSFTWFSTGFLSL